MNTLRLALAQINPTVGDIPANEARILDFLRRAEDQGADLVLLPELCVCGYPPEDLLLKQDFLRAVHAAQERIAQACERAVAVMGWLETGAELHNCAAVLQHGKMAALFRKHLLPNYGVFDEVRYFRPGRGNAVFELGPVLFGATVCEDIWSADGPFADQARAGARLLVNVSASPFHMGKGELRREMLAERAKACNAAIAYCNCVGGQDELVFDGQSRVLGPDGQVLAQGLQFQEELLLVDLDMGMLGKSPAPASAPANVERIVLAPLAPRAQRAPVAAPLREPLSRVAEAYEALVLGTRDYVRKNGFREAVIGLSGGVDSALTATLAADALGPENVHGVAMPSRYSSDHSLADAEQLAKNLGIDYLVLPIEDAFAAYLQTLAPLFKGRDQDVTEENLQPRIRGNLLMALSNKFGWLVLATGNKSETGVGYSTLYGDTAGGFAVIKDAPKTLVYELCRLRNERAGFDLIPEHVLTKPPSAELKPDQKDIDSLPPYEVLDPILAAYIEQDLDMASIAAQGFDPAVVRRVIAMVDRNEYKRRQSPPGVKLTTRSFGKDWRVPITNRYKAR